MNDFLDSLVNRSLHPEESLQPRLPRLFEPLTLGADPNSGFSAESELEYQPVEPRAVSLLPPVISPGTSRVPGGKPNLADPPPATQVTPTTVVPPFVPSISPSQAAVPSGENASNHAPAIIPAFSHPVSVPVPTINDILEVPAPLESREAVELSSHGLNLQARPVQQPSPVTQIPVPRAQHPVKANIFPVPTGSEEIAPAVLEPPHTEFAELSLPGNQARLLPQAPPFTAQQAGVALGLPASAPSAGLTLPPTIEVTIGRIEVRAATQTPPARKPANPAPRLTLDEYLRQRAGGIE